MQIYLVDGYNEWSFPHLEQLNRLHSLGLQSMHEIHHQDGNVAQPRSARAQVSEGLVP